MVTEGDKSHSTFNSTIFRSFGIVNFIQNLCAFIQVLLLGGVLSIIFLGLDRIPILMTILPFFVCPPLLIVPTLGLVIVAYSLRKKYPEKTHTHFFLVKFSNRILIGFIFLVIAESSFYSVLLDPSSDILLNISLSVLVFFNILYNRIQYSNWAFFYSFVTRFSTSDKISKSYRVLRIGLNLDVFRYPITAGFIFVSLNSFYEFYVVPSIIILLFWFVVPPILYFMVMRIAKILIRSYKRKIK